MKERHKHLFICLFFSVSRRRNSKASSNHGIELFKFLLLIFIHFNFHFDISNRSKQSLACRIAFVSRRRQSVDDFFSVCRAWGKERFLDLIWKFLMRVSSLIVSQDFSYDEATTFYLKKDSKLLFLILNFKNNFWLKHQLIPKEIQLIFMTFNQPWPNPNWPQMTAVVVFFLGILMKNRISWIWNKLLSPKSLISLNIIIRQHVET